MGYIGKEDRLQIRFPAVLIRVTPNHMSDTCLGFVCAGSPKKNPQIEMMVNGMGIILQIIKELAWFFQREESSMHLYAHLFICDWIPRRIWFS